MNILITLYSTSWGGAEESILNLAEEISKNDNNVFLLWLANYDSPKPVVNFPRVRIFYFRLHQKLYKLTAGWLVAGLSLLYKIDVANLNWRFVDEECRFLKLLNVRSIATVRAILFDRSSCDEFKNVDAIIGVSKAVVRQIRALGFQKPCFVIYNGIQIEKLKPFNNKLFASDRIYSMSRLVPWKRVDWSIRAISILHKQGYPFRFDIYGEGPERDNLQKLIKELNAQSYIFLRGYVNVRSSKLKNYGIFLIPSFKEPFGKTVVEAVICGRVIVGSRSGAIPELLPKYGLLFKYDDSQNYVEKIAQAFKNYPQYSETIIKRQQEFKEKYNMKRVAKDYIKAYHALLNRTEKIS